jgi:hypothetical protein
LAAGVTTVRWNGHPTTATRVPAGQYLLRVQASGNPAPAIVTEAGGATELLGGVTYGNRSDQEYAKSVPRFVISDSRLGASHATIPHTGAHHDPVVRETRGGETRESSKARVHPRYTG